MRPVYLRLDDFLVYNGHFEVDFSNIQSCIVSGKNASGKSTLILDSILFALYGQARQKAAGCISLGKEYAKVDFTFIQNDIRYQIIREVSIKPTHKITIYKDGEQVKAGTFSETQKYFEQEILGFSKELFLHLCFSLQGQVDSFAQQSPSEKEDLLSEILQYKDWDLRKSLAGKELTALREQKQQIENVKETLEQKQKDLKQFEIEIGRVHNQLNVKRNALDTFYPEYNQMQELVRTAREAKVIQDQVIKLKNAYLKDMQRLTQELSSIQNSQKYLNSIGDLASYKDEVKEKTNQIVIMTTQLECLNTEITEYFRLNNICKQIKSTFEFTQFLDNVPCKQLDIYSLCPLLSEAVKQKTKAIEEFHTTFSVDSIDLFNGLFLEISKKINELDLGIKHRNDLLSTLIKEEKIAQKKLDELKLHEDFLRTHSNVAELEEKISQTAKEIELCNSKLLSHEYFVELEKQWKDKTVYINSLLSEMKSFEDRILYLQAGKDGIIKDVGQLQKMLDEAVDYFVDENDWKYLISLYDKIPSVLFSEIVPFVENEANNILQILGVSYQLKIVVFKETKNQKSEKKAFDITYLSENGEISFNSLSGSEKFKQALALRIALSKTLENLSGVHVGMFVLDEGFGCLDPEGLADIKMVLEPVANQFEFFCVISHVDELKDVFDTQIVVDSDLKDKIQIFHN